MLTYVLIGINVAVALGALLGGASATGGGIGGSTLLQDGAVSRPEIADGEYWRLVTAGFLHAGFFHLLFNMLSLYILGGLLEPAVGRLRFGLIYFVSLLAGLVRRAAARAHVAHGGRLGRHLRAHGRHRGGHAQPRHEHHGERARHLDRAEPPVITFSVPNISIGGHIGGLVGGGLAAFRWSARPGCGCPRGARRWRCAALCAAGERVGRARSSASSW